MGYMLRRICSLSPKKVIYNIRETAKESGKSEIYIFMDMLICFFKYGAGYIDYRAYSFYDMQSKMRKTYLTRTGYRNFLLKVNDSQQSRYFDNKALFNKRFEKYLHRAYLDLSNATFSELCEFLNSHGSRYFVEPVEGEGGKGIWVLEKDEYVDTEDAANAVFGAKDCVIEEAIVQHPDLQKLNPDSVNCMRVMTFIDDDKNPVPIAVMQKIGFKGNVCDNRSIYILTDPKKGVTVTKGHIVLANGDDVVYENHPDYGYEICGLHIPYVKEAVNMCLKAALELPKVRFVGWDVAITPDGAAIIEGNNFPTQWDCQYFLSQEGKEGLISVLHQYTKTI